MADHKGGAAESPLQIQPQPVRGRPFANGQSGNPAGKPVGTRNRATHLLETRLEGQAEAIMVPRRRDRVVPFELPTITCAEDAVKAYDAVMAAVADGTPTLEKLRGLLMPRSCDRGCRP